jgi:uncharacterized phage protein gp47/JayE
MSGVTSQGFESKQYTEIVEDLAAKAKSPAYFGEQFPVTPDSKYGVLSGVFGAALREHWELSGAVADQGNRDKAEGKYLDDLAALIGLTRLLANGSTGILIFTGTNSAVVPINTPIKSTNNKEIVLTKSALTLNRSACYSSKFTIPAVVAAEVYSIDVNGANYEHTATAGQTPAQVLTILKDLIVTGGGTVYTATLVGTTLTVTSGTENNNLLTTNTTNVTLLSVSSAVESVAATAGAIQFFSSTLTTVVNAIIGITSVTNPTTFNVGRNEETDPELRIRMDAREQSTGTATKPSIEASISEVTGVSFALVIENTTFAVDGSGRPPKSYETYVAGGLNSSVATVVWETKPAGIETWGDISNVVIDHNGDSQVVKFSRFQDKYAWVKVTYSINSEEEFFPDGEQLIKDAVVETGSKFYRGEDFEPTKFYGNIYSKVSGIFISLIEVAITDLPTDTPTYSSARLPVSNITNLIFSTARVIPTV